MNDNQMREYMRKQQEAMRPMTEAEIADRQRRQAPLMCNNLDAMRGGADMRNFRTIDANEVHWIPDKPKPTFWQRVKRRFLGHNAEVKGGSE